MDGDYAFWSDGFICLRVSVDNLPGDMLCFDPGHPTDVTEKFFTGIGAIDYAAFVPVQNLVGNTEVEVCTVCAGSGKVALCEECGGEWVVRLANDSSGYECDCKGCNGHGFVSGGDEICEWCDGEGKHLIPALIVFGDNPKIGLNSVLVDKLRVLPCLEINTHCDSEERFYLRFSGGDGVVMGMRV